MFRTLFAVPTMESRRSRRRCYRIRSRRRRRACFRSLRRRGRGRRHGHWDDDTWD